MNHSQQTPRFRQLVALGALLLSQGMAQGDEPPATVAITPTVAEDFYDLFGNSIDELNAEVRAKGPMESDGDGIRRYAVTLWEIGWSARVRKVGKKYAIESVEISLAITFHLPRRVLPKGQRDRVAAEWQRFYAALIVHENGHADTGRVHAEMIRTALTQPQLFESRRQLQQFVQVTGSRIIAHGNSADSLYDIQTGHGRTQGAILK